MLRLESTFNGVRVFFFKELLNTGDLNDKLVLVALSTKPKDILRSNDLFFS